MAEQKEMKYEEAMNRLEEIVGKMESGQLDIDSISKNLKEARKLIALCKDKLFKTEEEINKIVESGEFIV